MSGLLQLALPVPPAAMEPVQKGDNREAEEMMGWFEDVTCRADLVQTETLRKILELNWGVEYLTQWLGGVNMTELDSSKALESVYRNMVPLAAHDVFEPLLTRVADGDTSPVLTQEPIELLSLR